MLAELGYLTVAGDRARPAARHLPGWDCGSPHAPAGLRNAAGPPWSRSCLGQPCCCSPAVLARMTLPWSMWSQHANSALPMGFKLAAVWGGHEGSMLFFVFALGL